MPFPGQQDVRILQMPARRFGIVVAVCLMKTAHPENHACSKPDQEHHAMFIRPGRCSPSTPMAVGRRPSFGIGSPSLSDSRPSSIPSMSGASEA